MRVLVTGAGGFLGGSIARHLRKQGHEVVCLLDAQEARRFDEPGCRKLVADFYKARDPADWWPLLQDIDAVVNAADNLLEPALRQGREARAEAPQALFKACVQASVRRVVQISVSGAHGRSRNALLSSKHAADQLLLSLMLDAVVIQPGLVFGLDDRLSVFTMGLASMPLIPLPGDGALRVMPLHLDDLLRCVAVLVQPRLLSGLRVPLGGPRAMTLRQYLQGLRQGLQWGPAHFLSLPMGLVLRLARIGRLTGAAFNDELWSALRRARGEEEAVVVRQLLGREPMGVKAFVPRAHRDAHRVVATLAWLRPLLRLAVALVWLLSGVLSLSHLPDTAPLALMGLHGPDAPPLAYPDWAMPLLYGVAGVDVLLAVESLVVSRRLGWAVQIGVVLCYALLAWLLLPPPAWPIVSALVAHLPLLGLLLVMALSSSP